MIFAPTEFSHALPSVWSKCQCVLIRWVIGIGAEIGERLGHLRARDADARVDEHLAVRAGQDGYVSP